MAKTISSSESWLMLWNPKEDPYSGEQFERAIEENTVLSLRWRVPFGQQMEGDLFFAKCSSKGKYPGIFAMGTCEENKEVDETGLVLRVSSFLTGEQIISNSELKQFAAPLLKRVGSGTVIDTEITAAVKDLFEARLLVRGPSEAPLRSDTRID